jgi:hypothetical protein
MIMVVRMLGVASLVLACSPSTVRAAPSPALQSVLGFCKAHMTVDFPPEKGFGSPEGGGVPPELLVINADTWRCLDGQVLVCADSADGDQCARKADDRHPRIVAEVCHDLGSSDDVPFYAGHPYRYDWACRGGKAVIIKTYPLDRRGFFQNAWARLVVRDGVVSPKEAPEVVR